MLIPGKNHLQKVPRLAYLAAVGAGVVGVILSVLYLQDKSQNTVDILTDNLQGTQVEGRITQGKNISQHKPDKLSTTETLVYESKSIETFRDTANAAYISWDQTHPLEDGVNVEMRVFDGKRWSDWIDATTDPDERPDNTEHTRRGGFIAGENIHQLQYRLKLKGTNTSPSPEVDSSTINLQIIDASKGPSLERHSAWQSLTKFVGFDRTASARTEGPRVHSRLVWGSPEPYDSPNWDTSYEPLNRTIVHHTATVPGSDSSATIRAIWEYHANTLGWGDIGYNYLVDQNGNIFQGRYFDAVYAEQHNVDVVGGHAYENNRGTTGIAALGDFTNTEPSNALLHYIGEVSAFKMGSYGLNPANGDTYGGNLLAHRDVLSTACPGQKLYNKLPVIRSVASALFPRYHVPAYAWLYINQYAHSDPARQVPIDLNSVRLVRGARVYLTVHAKNTGTKIWYPDNNNPVRLGTSSPIDRTSAMCQEEWLSCSRATNIAEQSVAPGQTGSFQYNVTIPENPTNDTYTFKEYFRPLAEGVVWMNDPGLYWAFTIDKPYAWQYVNQHAYLDASHTTPVDLNSTTLNPGQKAYVVVEAKNIGTNSWSSSGMNPVRLGSSNPQDRSSSLCSPTWLSCGRPGGLTEDVSPQEIGRFEIEIVAPQNTTGREIQVKEYFNILSEGRVWLNDPGLYWVVKVRSD